uniref:Secreted protein n=1 Tax=Rhipicephalus appendiculatus TaxID=34631 RepID=A0A131YBW4_RHIAP
MHENWFGICRVLNSFALMLRTAILLVGSDGSTNISQRHWSQVRIPGSGRILWLNAKLSLQETIRKPILFCFVKMCRASGTFVFFLLAMLSYLAYTATRR